MANTTNPRRNAEGYSDPTAYEALKNIEREEVPGMGRDMIVR